MKCKDKHKHNDNDNENENNNYAYKYKCKDEGCCQMTIGPQLSSQLAEEMGLKGSPPTARHKGKDAERQESVLAQETIRDQRI